MTLFFIRSLSVAFVSAENIATEREWITDKSHTAMNRFLKICRHLPPNVIQSCLQEPANLDRSLDVPNCESHYFLQLILPHP